MFEKNYYETMAAFIKKSDFGEPRDYGYATFHAGDDYTSRRFKKQDVYNLIAGVGLKKRKAKFAGNYVILRHNFKHIGGVDEDFFSCYKHLDSIAKFIKKLEDSEMFDNIELSSSSLDDEGKADFKITAVLIK